MPGERIACPVCGCRIGRAYMRRHKGSPTCLSYRVQANRADVRLKELAAKGKAQERTKRAKSGTAQILSIVSHISRILQASLRVGRTS